MFINEKALLDSNRNDISLWESFLKGDASSLGFLFKQYYSHLFQYGSKICNDTQVLEDSIQELFLELWRNKNAVPNVSIKAYLFRALKYKLIKQIREGNADSIELLDDHAFVLSHESFLVTAQEEKAIGDQLKRALTQLSDRQREVIYLKFYHQMGYEEVSAIMNINYQATRNLLYQAMKSLRRSLSSPMVRLRVSV